MQGIGADQASPLTGAWGTPPCGQRARLLLREVATGQQGRVCSLLRPVTAALRDSEVLPAVACTGLAVHINARTGQPQGIAPTLQVTVTLCPAF